MRGGVAFTVRNPMEGIHVRPLVKRLVDQRAGIKDAKVLVHTGTDRPRRGLWNVQIFHGLRDPATVGNPIFLQRGRAPALRSIFNALGARVGLDLRLLRPPARPGRRACRYDAVNAYGPRFRDYLQATLDAEVLQHGHIGLNERQGLRPTPGGHLVWLPSWDARRHLGGQNRSGLDAFAREVALCSKHMRVVVKVHPNTLRFGQAAAARAELGRARGVQMVAERMDPYDLLRGARGVLTDSSAAGLEAYLMGFPVAICDPPGLRPQGIHAELRERATLLSPGRPDLMDWALDPATDHDKPWIHDLLYEPQRARNDALADRLRQEALRGGA